MKKKPAADPDTRPRTPEDVSRILKARRDRERELRARKAKGVELGAEDAAFLAKADEEIADAARAIASTPAKSPELARAENMLERILGAFGGGWSQMRNVDRRQLTLARGELTDDKAAYLALYEQEITREAAFIASILEKIESLRASDRTRLWRPGDEDYRRRWQEIVDEWNRKAVRADTLPTLCEICGTPIFAKALEHGVNVPTICGEKCWDARRRRIGRNEGT